MNESQSNYILLLHSLLRTFVGTERYKIWKGWKPHNVKSGYLS